MNILAKCRDQQLADGLAWLNEPPEWRIDSEGLLIVPAAKTDFFRPYTGTPNDSACLLYTEVTGDFTAMTLSLLGLGAILSASATLFNIFKWVGVIYLIYLGIKLWRLDPKNNSIKHNAKNSSARSLLKSSFIVTALNPKSIAFFVAFLPQFIDPLRPVFFQLTLLGGTFLLLATINATLYAFFAGQLIEYMRKRNIRKFFNWCGGSALIGAGIFTAAMKRSA